MSGTTNAGATTNLVSVVVIADLCTRTENREPRTGMPRQIGSWFLVLLASLPDRHLERLEGAAADDLRGQCGADAVAGQERLQLVGVGDGLAVQFDQDVAQQQAGLRGGA